MGNKAKYFCSLLALMVSINYSVFSQSAGVSNRLLLKSNSDTARLSFSKTNLSNKIRFSNSVAIEPSKKIIEPRTTIPFEVQPSNKITSQERTPTVKPVEKVSIKSIAKTSEVNESEISLKENLGQFYAGKIPSYYALIIGVSKYQYDGPSLSSLAYPVDDAKRFRNLVVDHYAFAKDNVIFLTDPVRADIITAFEQLAERISEKDNLLIFYAGHGYLDKAKNFGYWLPANANPENKSEWISNTIIRDYLGAIPAKHTLLISDACFGGSIFKSRGLTNSTTQKIFELYKYSSRRAMTSGNLTLVPDKSVFTDVLIRRLEENTDPFLPAQNLFYRIFEPVSNNSVSTPQFGVVQGTGDDGGDFIFIKTK